MASDLERANMIQESFKQRRINIRKEINDLYNELLSEYRDDLAGEILSGAAILKLATEIVMNEEENYRHDEREGNKGFVYGAMNN